MSFHLLLQCPPVPLHAGRRNVLDAVEGPAKVVLVAAVLKLEGVGPNVPARCALQVQGWRPEDVTVFDFHLWAGCPYEWWAEPGNDVLLREGQRALLVAEIGQPNYVAWGYLMNGLKNEDADEPSIVEARG